MSPKPHCAVVIPTYNGVHLLTPCLEALLANPPERCTWDLIVVDDASSDSTVQRLRAYRDRITIVARESNGGFATACNDGLRAASSADAVVFLNNDTVPIAGWLDALIDTADEYPGAGAVGAKLLFPDGTVQHAGVTIGQDRWPHNLYAGLPGEHEAANRPREVIAVTAACMLVRRELLEQLGGFDTAFHNGFEDVDLCLRLRELGHEIRYCPRSVAYHLESVTRWADGMDVSGHNERLYRERWGDRVEPDDMAHYLGDGLVTVEYGPFYPVRLSISPDLATITRGNHDQERLEHLLEVRSEQVMEMSSARTRAAVEHRRDEAAWPTARAPGSPSGGEPRILNVGTPRRLGGRMRRPGRTQRRVSVLMPVMDAGADLREILPLLLSQNAAVELEVVAVDSASRDDTVEVLADFGATVLAIDPAEFDHGLTRNLAAHHATGDVLVFVNGRTRPADPDWLGPLVAALDDPTVAGACSRIAPHPDAELLTRRDGERELSGSEDRQVKRIDDWDAYRSLSTEERRLLLNFHTVSAAIRADVLERIPFQSVRAIGEDLLWAREVLESGLALVHEPASLAYHSHDYSLAEWLMRNVDDGIANCDINGRVVTDGEADALARGMIASDWSHLRSLDGLDAETLERLQIQAALRRAAQVAGQWMGTNHTRLPAEAVTTFSRVANMRREA